MGCHSESHYLCKMVSLEFPRLEAARSSTAHHPVIENVFKAGKFTFDKIQRRFPAIPIDQAYKQNKNVMKRDDGAIGLMDNPTVLR